MFEIIVDKVMSELYQDYWKELERKRIEDALKLYRWYSNDKDAIISYVKAALLKTFRQVTVDQMNIRVRNIVPRVIDKVAQIYKLSAKRMLDGGLKTETKGKDIVPVQSDSDKLYQQILLHSTVNAKAKRWHRLGLLFNTVLVQPIVIRSGTEPYLDFLIHTPAFTVVEIDEENPSIPTSFFYQAERTIAGKSQEVLVYWSKESHYLIDKLGNKFAPPSNDGMINPYNRLPIAVLRFNDCDDFWGEGRWSLVEGNEEVAVQYSNIAYTALFQTHGQAVAINTGLKGEPEVGPDRVVKIENAGANGQQTSDFKFANANPMLSEVQNMIDWLVKSIQGDEGLSPQQFATEISNSSGVAKILDNSDLNEQRADDRQILEDFEHDLYEVTKAVWNVEVPNRKLSDKAEFSVQFGEPKVVKTVDEKIKEREASLNNGTASRIDFIMEDYPELTREQAEQKLEQIILENQKFKDKYSSFFESLNSNDNGNSNNAG